MGERDRHMHLRINIGIGFDREADNPSRGPRMISMQERAGPATGALEVRSELDRGTATIAAIPVERHA